MSMSAYSSARLRRLTMQTLQANGISKTSSECVNLISDLTAKFIALLAESSVDHANLSGRTVPNALDGAVALSYLGIDLEDLYQWSRDQYQSQTADLDAENVGQVKERTSVQFDPAKGQVLLEYEPILAEEDESDSDSDLVKAEEVEEPIATESELSVVERPSAQPDEPMQEVDSFEKQGSPESTFSNGVPLDLSDGPKSFPVQVSAERHISVDLAEETEGVEQPVIVPVAMRATAAMPSFAQLELSELYRKIDHQQAENMHPIEDIPGSPKRSPPSEPDSAHPFLLVAMQAAHENANAGGSNPSRLLLSSVISHTASTKYSVADSLYKHLDSPSIHVLGPAPTHPVPIDGAPSTERLQSIVEPRALSTKALHPLPHHLATHTHNIAQRVIKPGLYERALTVTAPPALMQEDGTPFLYGQPHRAPWNVLQLVKTEASVTSLPDGAASTLTPSILYSTWDATWHSPEDSLRRPARLALSEKTS